MRKLILLFSLLFLNNIAFSKDSLDEKSKEEVLNVLEVNEALHASFFKYNAKDVQANAEKTAAAIAKVSNKEVKKLLENASKKLSEIKEGADRESNNKNYHQASMAMIYVINKYDLGDKYSGYRCPMVKKKWVQNSQKMGRVHNPYAPEMPHCGGRMK
ncbi:hypothetical protein [Halobacteriovorax sp. JY17]|uniref:hypothetical protein n=1 Tax=Halobacteriovorax sp. JY17 TaxID=2014617 RepID=UPI000C352290|nr:hypothetical protein [Halobacteriovorax sp. JY17]PIK13635.1 MAG: hypothetical protein CES88_15705 [Halobacteriovorax sp. JY17]